VILHSNDQDRTSCFILAAVSIFARSVNFPYDLLLFRYLIRSVIFIPFDPISPHFDDLFFFEVSGYAESSCGVYVGVEVFLLCDMLVLLFEYIDHLLLIGFHLGQLAVGNEERVGVGCLFHCCCYIN